MKLGDFLNNLAQKGNMGQDPALISLLSNSAIATMEIADTFANSLDQSLMSLDGAKNNPQVLNHFKPIILKAVDDKMAIIGEKFGLGDDFTLERNTYKKTELLESKIEAKIKELEAKQGKATDPVKEAQFTTQIQDLQGKLAAITDQRSQEIDGLKNQHSAEMTDMLVKFGLTNKKYANKDIPSEVNVMTAKMLLQNEMTAKGAILVNENGTLKLKQSANPTMDYVDAGFKAVSYNDFVDGTLTTNKLLEVSGAQTPTQPTVPTSVPMAQPTQNMSKFEAAMAKANS